MTAAMPPPTYTSIARTGTTLPLPLTSSKFTVGTGLYYHRYLLASQAYIAPVCYT
jgi:hypothetical protein